MATPPRAAAMALVDGQASAATLGAPQASSATLVTREPPRPAAERSSFYVPPVDDLVQLGAAAAARRLPKPRQAVVIDDPQRNSCVWPSSRPSYGPPQRAGYSMNGVRYNSDGLRKPIAPERLSSRISSRRAAKRRSASSWGAILQDGSFVPRSSPLLSSAHRLWTPPPEMRGHAASSPRLAGFEIRSEVGRYPGSEGRQTTMMPIKPNLRAPAVDGRSSLERHAFGGGFHNPRAATGQSLRLGATPRSLAPLPLPPQPPRGGPRPDELLSFTGEALAVSSSMPHLPLPAKAAAARGGGGGASNAVRWPRAALV